MLHTEMLVARGFDPPGRLRHRRRARLVPPADRGPGRRRPGRAGDPLGARRRRDPPRGGERRQCDDRPRQGRRPEARHAHRQRAEGQGRRIALGPGGAAEGRERRQPMRCRRSPISASAPARRRGGGGGGRRAGRGRQPRRAGPHRAQEGGAVAMRTLVIGATGDVGRAIVRRLRELDHEVTGLARSVEARARLAEAGAGAVDGDGRKSRRA